MCSYRSLLLAQCLQKDSWTSSVSGVRPGFQSRLWTDNHVDAASTTIKFSTCRDALLTSNNDSATIHLWREISLWPDEDRGSKTLSCYTSATGNWGAQPAAGPYSFIIDAITGVTDSWQTLNAGVAVTYQIFFLSIGVISSAERSALLIALHVEIYNSMALSFSHMTFSYRTSAQPVFNDFSWQVPPGRTVLLGPNGAGKSTLLALGADALRPTRGRICFQALESSRRSDRAAYRRAVGWMPQHVRAVPGLTAQEQVAYAAWLKGASQTQAWAAAAIALERVGLATLAERATSTLSGGQLRRVGLAQVLAHDANVLLLDEPTVGLDPAQRARFRELLAALPRMYPIVVSTHQVDDLTDVFDTVVVINNGLIAFQGPVAAFMQLAPSTLTERRAEAAYAQSVSGED